ncbi:hypothetical protein VP01_3191g2 [Puccinia sorghi]|uniref:DUF7872 domain-containing protein n=1 Tax=Puccinia sorghi TaxID=27349 RepID=A0A0L6UYP4_9BASI|nr:hypothetical protein VP01_3191g2 [Puccinia sorghi]
MTFPWRNTCTMVVFGAIFSQSLGLTEPSHQESSSPHLVRRLLTPAQTWVDLGIDEYIQNYPNADKLTIQEFAAELNMPNFFCGIGMQCSAGQLCHPAAGVNWLILYAIQEWNAYMNSFYTAIEDAISLMRDASADIASDFIPRVLPDKGLYGWSVATVVVGILATFTGLIIPAVLPENAMQMVVDATKIGVGAGLVGAVSIPTIGRTTENERFMAELEAIHAQANGEQPADIWSHHDSLVLQEFLDQRSQAARQPPSSASSNSPRYSPASLPPSSPRANGPPQPEAGSTPSPHLRKRTLTPDELPKKRHPAPYAFGIVSGTVQIATLQPLLAQGGIAEILREGSFLYSNPTQTFMTENVKALAQITALSEFFKSIKMFVTIGSDDCKFKGPNGAKNNKQDLSSCTKDGLMMNIIRAEGNKVVNKTPNAHLLQSKYGYSVEYLANLAWDCQKKYGVQKEGQSTFPPPTNIHSDCVFSIPVCDCTLPEVKHLRQKHKSTVVACRKGAGLPI